MKNFDSKIVSRFNWCIVYICLHCSVCLHLYSTSPPPPTHNKKTFKNDLDLDSEKIHRKINSDFYLNQVLVK